MAVETVGGGLRQRVVQHFFDGFVQFGLIEEGSANMFGVGFESMVHAVLGAARYSKLAARGFEFVDDQFYSIGQVVTSGQYYRISGA